jgi:hypothetical protein
MNSPWEIECARLSIQLKAFLEFTFRNLPLVEHSAGLFSYLPEQITIYIITLYIQRVQKVNNLLLVCKYFSNIALSDEVIIHYHRAQQFLDEFRSRARSVLALKNCRDILASIYYTENNGWALDYRHDDELITMEYQGYKKVGEIHCEQLTDKNQNYYGFKKVGASTNNPKNQIEKVLYHSNYNKNVCTQISRDYRIPKGSNFVIRKFHKWLRKNKLKTYGYTNQELLAVLPFILKLSS